MAHVNGVIEQVQSRQHGSVTMYNVTVDGKTYGCGPIKPRFKEGDRVQFDVEQRGMFQNVVIKTLKEYELQDKSQEEDWDEVPKIAKPLPLAQVRPPTAQSVKQIGPAPVLMGRDDFWKRKEDRDVAKEEAYVQRELERQKAINFDSARKAAMEYVGLLRNCLGESFWLKKNMKPGEQMDYVRTLVEDRTREFYQQAVERERFLSNSVEPIAEDGDEIVEGDN